MAIEAADVRVVTDPAIPLSIESPAATSPRDVTSDPVYIDFSNFAIIFPIK
jgi:hypothetical protein